MSQLIQVAHADRQVRAPEADHGNDRTQLGLHTPCIRPHGLKRHHPSPAPGGGQAGLPASGIQRGPWAMGA